MTDNTRINTNTTTGDLIADKDYSGVKYQRVILVSDNAGTPIDGTLSVPYPVQVVTFNPGTAGISLGKALDQTQVAGDVGVAMWGQRQDADTTIASATGKYAPFQLDASGNVKVYIKGGASSGAVVDASTYTRGSSSAVPFAGVCETSAPTVVNGKAATASFTTGGALRVDVASGSISGIADDAAVTVATTQVLMAGYMADDTSTDSIDEGDGGMARMTLNRKQIVQPYEGEGNSWSYAAAAAGLVTTSEVTAKAAAGAGLRNYVTSIQVTNSHPTIGSEVQILDDTAGTVIHRGFAAPLGGYTATLVVPIKSAVNKPISIKEATGTASTGILVNLQGYVSA